MGYLTNVSILYSVKFTDMNPVDPLPGGGGFLNIEELDS